MKKVRSKDGKAAFDSKHEVVASVKLRADAELHRFRLRSGAAWSAIYIGPRECIANPRNNERDMIMFWNDGEYLSFV